MFLKSQAPFLILAHEKMEFNDVMLPQLYVEVGA